MIHPLPLIDVYLMLVLRAAVAAFAWIRLPVLEFQSMSLPSYSDTRKVYQEYRVETLLLSYLNNTDYMFQQLLYKTTLSVLLKT